MHIEKNRRIIKECIGDFLNCECLIDNEGAAKPITFFNWDTLNIVNKIEFLSETFSETFKDCDIKERFGHLFKIIEEETEFGTVVAPIEFHQEWLPIGMVGDSLHENDFDSVFSADNFKLLIINLTEENEGFPLYSIDFDERHSTVTEPSPFLSSLMELQVRAS